ncbi:hypothetical protein AGOR_G00162120 [Albula goreensis]|uniref:Apolipoprotein F n=1 Tax=Albula goreensis TaxID=1534307 RepID=A0A8T3D645_9TELE|nr:hypothetical protein AGOR_G00162120 [Albula goreensis]
MFGEKRTVSLYLCPRVPIKAEVEETVCCRYNESELEVAGCSVALFEGPRPLRRTKFIWPEYGLNRGSAVEEDGKPLPSGSSGRRGGSSVAKEGGLGAGENPQEEEDRELVAQLVVASVTAGLQGNIRTIALRGDASCQELLASASLGGTSSALFPRELVGLSMVPVLGVSGCPQEAQALVLQLFEMLGVADTEELLMEIKDLIERDIKPHASTIPLPPMGKAQAERHLQAVMFNIRQLARTGESPGSSEAENGDEGQGRCEGWTRVNGTSLLGDTMGEELEIREAVQSCEGLGDGCAGVTGGAGPGRYRVVLRSGSRIVPIISSESWIRECQEPVEPGRVRRSLQRNCVNKREERVYNVVEWIPGVSTLYNLGTAVYYASVNCSETAKERAILSAVDLGTDALMAVTGGTVGVAGYALGAGVKTGVKAGIKYLLNTMKHEDDLIVNRNSWNTSITVQ